MSLPQHAPWDLHGECIVGFARAPRSPLPAGLSHLPGPALIVASRYDDSPVGPYVELAVAEPARLGLRPGLSVTTVVVSSVDSRVGGIVNWGFPKEVGTLEWLPDSNGEGVELAWKERGLRIHGRPLRRPTLPVLLPLPALQRRGDGPVLVPARVSGWGHLARVTVEVPALDDPLAGMAGVHWGLHVRGLRLVIHPARHPTGLLTSLTAPLRAPEPALSSADPRGRLAQR